MKKYLIYLMMAAAVMAFGACSPEDENEPQTPEIENPEKPDDGGEDTPDDPEQPGDNPDTPGGNGKILVAYFSWGGTTQRMAQEIVRQTGADLFRIEPVVPYPTEYTPCTEVAREEKDNNARPAIVSKVENWADYDTVFIGCPVWWWTTPMIICTFAESYDFKGKTVVPFCTYAATYRDETLARIVELTPDAEHLTGEGLTSGRINEQNISSWLKEIGLIE
ncbi:flavodoxin [Phocaeicola massiliensis]|uniref:flavodoxin n=1 Tax=Phocaeicola massiliensis TaxID=204516 RepID=UPI001E2F291A|nr:flavodoxin [Phocaeicola massiliensis]